MCSQLSCNGDSLASLYFKSYSHTQGYCPLYWVCKGNNDGRGEIYPGVLNNIVTVCLTQMFNHVSVCVRMDAQCLPKLPGRFPFLPFPGLSVL